MLLCSVDCKHKMYRLWNVLHECESNNMKRAYLCLCPKTKVSSMVEQRFNVSNSMGVSDKFVSDYINLQASKKKGAAPIFDDCKIYQENFICATIVARVYTETQTHNQLERVFFCSLTVSFSHLLACAHWWIVQWFIELEWKMTMQRTKQSMPKQLN